MVNITAAIAAVSIWRFFVSFCGTVIVLFAVISFVLVLGEMLYYKMNIHLTNDIAKRTGSIPTAPPMMRAQAAQMPPHTEQAGSGAEQERGIADPPGNAAQKPDSENADETTDSAAGSASASETAFQDYGAEDSDAAPQDYGAADSDAAPQDSCAADSDAAPQDYGAEDSGAAASMTVSKAEAAVNTPAPDPVPATVPTEETMSETVPAEETERSAPDESRKTDKPSNENPPRTESSEPSDENPPHTDNSESSDENPPHTDGSKPSDETPPPLTDDSKTLNRDSSPQSGGSTQIRAVSKPPRIALITGASSGLGREYARQVDTQEKNIDEIWLIARRKEALEATARGLTHTSRVIPMDLTDKSSISTLSEMLTAADARIGLLISCAGFAKIGNYSQISLEDSDRMIDLNCRAAVDVTLCALPHMSAGDRIMEICSTAAFQPLQHINIYAAGKAFLYNYTRALRTELLPRGIIVTAVCPYWIKDTEFIPVATDNPSSADTSASIKSFPFSVTANSVASKSLRASRAGWAVCTPGVFCTIHRIFSKLIPRQALIYMWEGLRRI